jgi:membrane protein YqaA with SNARE-associated domain
MDLFASFGLVGLFLANVISSSVLPFPAEPAIVAAIAFYSVEIVFIITVFGATLGSVTNYYIGFKGLRKLSIFQRERKKEKRAREWVEKYGFWSLIIVQWIPLIGDPAMVVMGALKADFKKFLLFLLVGEIIRAGVIIYFGISVLSLI